MCTNGISATSEVSTAAIAGTFENSTEDAAADLFQAFRMGLIPFDGVLAALIAPFNGSAADQDAPSLTLRERARTGRRSRNDRAQAGSSPPRSRTTLR